MTCNRLDALRMPINGINTSNMGDKIRPTRHGSPQRVGEAIAQYATQPTGLADALFTTGQQRVLGLLFGQPQRSFTVSDIIAATGTGSGAAQREVTKLLVSGLVEAHPFAVDAGNAQGCGQVRLAPRLR